MFSLKTDAGTHQCTIILVFQSTYIPIIIAEYNYVVSGNKIPLTKL
jgi:hypothetical protein